MFHTWGNQGTEMNNLPTVTRQSGRAGAGATSFHSRAHALTAHCIASIPKFHGGSPWLNLAPKQFSPQSKESIKSHTGTSVLLLEERLGTSTHISLPKVGHMTLPDLSREV